jgi:thiol:disulfide interchange protein
MGKYAAIALRLISVLAVNGPASSQPAGITDANTGNTPVELVRYEKEFSTARLEPARMGQYAGTAVIFEGTDGLHYYAKAETAPAAGFELKVEAKSDKFEFGRTIFPKWHTFTEGLGSKIEVYSGRFTVFVPIKTVTASTKAAVIKEGDVEVKISGIACTSTLCLPPFEKTLWARIDISPDLLKEISFETAGAKRETDKGPAYSTWFALLLAFIAGLVLNIMPCVLPVIPLKVLSILEQAKESKARCIALGLSFCLGILLFFAGIAVLNIILRLGYGSAFQWGDHIRRPVVVIAMSILMVVLSLFLFGVITFIVPPSIAGKARPRKGYAGSISMGFLAAILSTPCSFAILTAAFAWAQTQRLALSTTAIMLIGIGMAAPYALLTSIPPLLKYLPKAGRWTELFKQTMGFVLLAVAVWLVTALPAERQTPVMYFLVILSFSIWMWGGCVTLTTPVTRRRIIQAIAVVTAVAAGMWLLPKPAPSQIDWLDYDHPLVDNALREAKPALIEFTANWCMTCKAVDKTVYSRKDIARLIKRKGVIVVKADTTLSDSPATIDLKQIYKEPGVPVSILFIPGKDKPERLHGLWIGDKLKELLESLPDVKTDKQKGFKIGQDKEENQG